MIRLLKYLRMRWSINTSWAKPYKNQPSRPETIVYSSYPYRSPLEMTDKEAVENLIACYGPKKTYPDHMKAI